MLDLAILLCERCGYVVDGLPEAGACPECGMAIAASLPERRVGTAAQRRHTWRACWATFVDVLRRPRREFDMMMIDSARSRVFRDAACLAAAKAAVAPAMFAVAVLTMSAQGPAVANALVGAALATVVGTVFMWAVLKGLTAIETAGVQFFGRRRGWRVSKAVADAVCGHACAGWVVGAAAGAIPWTLGILLSHQEFAPAAASLMVIGQACGWLLGLLWFETLVFIGIRRCRFANSPRRPTSAAGSPA